MSRTLPACEIDGFFLILKIHLVSRKSFWYSACVDKIGCDCGHLIRSLPDTTHKMNKSILCCCSVKRSNRQNPEKQFYIGDKRQLKSNCISYSRDASLRKEKIGVRFGPISGPKKNREMRKTTWAKFNLLLQFPDPDLCF